MGCIGPVPAVNKGNKLPVDKGQEFVGPAANTHFVANGGQGKGIIPIAEAIHFHQTSIANAYQNSRFCQSYCSIFLNSGSRDVEVKVSVQQEHYRIVLRRSSIISLRELDENCEAVANAV